VRGGAGRARRALRCHGCARGRREGGASGCAPFCRLKKELAAYHEEVVKVTTRVENMRAEGRDEHDIKKQAEVLAETEMMIPDTARRIEAAVHDLSEYLVRRALRPSPPPSAPPRTYARSFSPLRRRA
jgi:Tubulin binding cofactor A